MEPSSTNYPNASFFLNKIEMQKELHLDHPDSSRELKLFLPIVFEKIKKQNNSIEEIRVRLSLVERTEPGYDARARWL